MKIKICCVDEDGRYGGPQSRMIDVYKNIDLNKITYDFLIPSDVKIFKKKLKKIKANFYEFEITRLSSDILIFLKYILFFPLEIFTLVKFFKEQNYKLIQINGVPHFKSFIAAKLSKTPVVWVIEDSYSPTLILLVFKILVKIFHTKIIYLSEKVYNFYLKDLGLKKKHLHKIMSPTDSNFFKRKKFKNKKSLRICTISGILNVKDTETFLNVAQEVLKKNINIEFIFAGRGTKSESSYYRKIMTIYKSMNLNLRKKILFLGMQQNVKRLLENSDIFLFTSKSEGGPIVIWEAMSMKLPIVTTKVGGTEEYIKNGYNGYLCSIGNHKEIADKILKLINDTETRKKFGIRSRKIVEQFLDSKVIGKKYQKVYESVYKEL